MQRLPISSAHLRNSTCSCTMIRRLVLETYAQITRLDTRAQSASGRLAVPARVFANMLRTYGSSQSSTCFLGPQQAPQNLKHVSHARWIRSPAGMAARPVSGPQSCQPSLHVGGPRGSTASQPFVCLQAAGGDGAGGSGGNKKGYSSGDSSSSNSGGGGLWAAYNKLLDQYPLLIKAITTAVLSAVGNLICQFAVEGKSELDWKRFNTFTALGFLWVAPCLHFWFGALNKIVTSPGNVGALMRMALDQLGFAPLFIGSMIGILTALEHKSFDQSFAAVKRDLPDAIRANWALWVPAQFINFRFVPATYQVLFANMVALVWNVYFSFATRPKATA